MKSDSTQSIDVIDETETRVGFIDNITKNDKKIRIVVRDTGYY